MRNVQRIWLASLCGLLALVSAGPLFAGGPNPGCVADAAHERNLCRDLCRENFQAAKDLCRNINHGCADACRAMRQTCLEGSPDNPGPLATLRSCIDTCNAALDAEKNRCRTEQCPEGSPDRETCLDACIDAAQVVAFHCRDGCRERARPGIKLCRDSFRACIRACPPAP
ncbi:MAG: hypothetical protein N3C12_01655 [Candidatus Binatia bacterium]|nr:hypothetical protein [Candidatus Binatia bacterium]